MLIMKLILVILRLGNICGLETIKSNLETNFRDFGLTLVNLRLVLIID